MIGIFSFITRYHEAIVNILDILAFSFVTPEFVPRETWNRIGEFSQKGAAVFGLATVRTIFRLTRWRVVLWVAMMVVGFFLVLAGLAFGVHALTGHSLYGFVTGHELAASPAEITEKVKPYTLRTALAIFIIMGIAQLISFLGFAAYMFAELLTIVKLGPVLLVIGIGLFFLARGLSIYVSIAEATAHAVDFSTTSLPFLAVVPA